MALLIRENVHISIFKIVNHFNYIIDFDAKKKMALMIKIKRKWLYIIENVGFGSWEEHFAREVITKCLAFVFMKEYEEMCCTLVSKETSWDSCHYRSMSNLFLLPFCIREQAFAKHCLKEETQLSHLYIFSLLEKIKSDSKNGLEIIAFFMLWNSRVRYFQQLTSKARAEWLI